MILYHNDEQIYVFTADGWVYIDCLQSIQYPYYPYANINIKKGRIQLKKYKKILTTKLVDEYEIETIVTDGAIAYPSIIEELDCNHKKMQNFINKIKSTLIRIKK